MNENNTNNIENNNIDIIINSNNNNNNYEVNEMNENNHIVNINGKEEEEEVEFNNNTIDNIIDNNSNDNNNNNNTNNNINNSNDSDNTNDKNNIEITVIEDNIVVEEINENEIYEITEIIDDDDNEMNDEEVIVTKTITTNNKNNNNTNDSEIIEIEDNDDNASILLDDEDEEENKKEEEVININNNDNNETTMQQQEENVIQIKEVMEEESNEIKEINNDNNNDNIITMNDNVQQQQLLDDGVEMSIIEPLNQQQLQQSPQQLQQQQNEMSIEPTTIIQQKEEEEQQLQQQQEELNNDSILLENDNNNTVNNIDYYQEIINKKERQKQKELEKKLKLNIVTSKIGDTILVKNLKDKQPSLKRKRINKKEQLEDENIEESDDDEEDQEEEEEDENDEEEEDDELFNFRAIKYYKEDNNNLIRENEEDKNEEEDEEQNEEEECFNFMYNSKEEFEREKQLFEQKRITKEEDDIKSNSDEDTDYFESEEEENNNNNQEEEEDDEMIEESNSSSGSGGEEREQQEQQQQKNELENELEKLMKEKVEYLHNVHFNQLKKEKIYKKYILEKNFTITQLKEKLIFYKQQLNQTKIEILQNNSKLENKNLNLIFKILKRQIKYEVLLLLIDEPPIIAPFPNKKVNVNKQQQQLNKERKELLDDMNDFIDDSNMEDEEINLKDSLMNQSPSQLETSLQSPNREEEAIKIKKIKYHIIPNQNGKNIILGNEFFNNLNFKKLLNGTVGICEILEKKIPYHFINIVMNQKVKKSAQQFKQQQEEEKEKENVNVSQLNTLLNEYKDVTNYGNLNIKIPSNIDAMDHQIDGLLFGIKQLKDKKSFIIAHEMGLGKTLTTLLLFLNYNLLTKKGSLKYLILTTKSNLNRFIDDYNYFFKNNYHFIENIIKIESSNELDKLNNYNNGIVLMSHRLLLDILKNEEIKNRILKINFNFFVIDEAQIIKNDKTQTYNSFMEIKTEFKILLSGTPLQNSLGDLFNLIKFIKNKMILNDKEFENEFIKYFNNNPINSKLNKFRLKLFTLLFNDSIHRVLFKESKLMDIKKYQHLIFYKPNLEILNIYDILQNKNVNFFTLNKTLRVILDAGSFIYNYSSKNSNNTIIEEQFEEEMIEEEIMNEQIKKNIYNSITSLVDKEIIPLNIEIKENNKIKILQNLINSIKVNDETDQIVIFTNYISYLPFLINELKIDYKIEMFTGTLTTKQRNEILFKFKNKEIDILFVSKKVGGVGIDLSNANHVIFYNLDFNYTNDLQCISRCYRNKQLKDVHVYTLLGMVNLDINLKMECHVKKATMINYVLDNIFIKNKLSGDNFFENCKERMKGYLDKFIILDTFMAGDNDEKDELLIGQDNLITSDNEEVDDEGFKCHCNEFFKRYPHLKKLNFFN
ncbi:hypothetical protein ABK040_015264 [Willaertia magna]